MSNDDQSVKTATAFTIIESSSPITGDSCDGDDAQMTELDASSELLLPDRLRKRLQAERKCRPTNEQLEQKLARAEQRRQKQFAKRAANAREADARCRRVAEAMEALHARRPESRAQVMQRFARLQRDLHGVLGRFNSEVESTNCALFAGAPLVAFGGGVPTMPPQPSAATASPQQLQGAGGGHKRRGGTAFVVAAPNADAASAAAAASSLASEMPARLKQRLAAYPRRRSRHELKVALEKKLAEAERRKERYVQRRADSIKETEERCRRISETMEEISLDQPATEAGAAIIAAVNGSTVGNGASNSSDYYRRVAKLQVDLDCMFTKFNREIVTVRGGRPIDLLETLQAGPDNRQRQLATVGCQTELQRCRGCGCDPNGVP